VHNAPAATLPRHDPRPIRPPSMGYLEWETMKTILVLFDNDILVSLEYDPKRTVKTQLDDYAEEYAMDRSRLIGVLLDHISLNKAA